MQYDFSRIDDIDSFISIPEGRYACRVAEVREGVSRDGSPRWSLRLEVAVGDYAGRTAGWDSLTWSERGIRRVKHVLDALGLDVSGQVEIVPTDLLGREVLATFQSEEREDAFTGRRVLRLRVPYAGYQAPDVRAPDAGAREANGRDEPFADETFAAETIAPDARRSETLRSNGAAFANSGGVDAENAASGSDADAESGSGSDFGARRAGRVAAERSPAGLDEEFED